MGEELALLNGFLPVRLLGKICGADRHAAAVEFSAAVMFVDVSRYTSLVEQLARRGQGGLEKIQRVLTQSYTRCAEEICDRLFAASSAAHGKLKLFEACDLDDELKYWRKSLEDDLFEFEIIAHDLCEVVDLIKTLTS